ncbi:5'-nucleotidase C-terminal domain-containing protein [Lysinibacillus sp. KU-BSD001]|uniref:S-layer homology domain-containing protein n=1 Tax=Lysinibacillus sp. KU-BSD001 TaxID=3141328 RepID=UPI0036DFE48E
MDKRKLFATVGAVTASLVAVSGVSAAGFTDVDAKNSHYENILTLHEAGVINGYADGTFKPSKPVTRGQAAKMLVNAFGLTKGPGTASFTDVPASNEYAEAIEILASYGFIKGYADGSFKPAEEITRGQFAKMVTSIFEITGKGANPFTDVASSSEYYEAIIALYENGLTTGTTAKTYSPDANVTRGQLASFIVRGLAWLEAAVEEPEEPTEQPEQPTEENTFDLSILHVNDTHANVAKFPKLVTAVKEYRAQNEDALLLHAGDVLSGTLYFNEFHGKADLALMKLMNFDAMTLGNHEFDLGGSEEGHQALVDFIKGANFPVLSANADFTKDAKFADIANYEHTADYVDGHLYKGIIKEVNGEKVGIFGLTTEHTEDTSSPGNVDLTNYLEAAEEAVAAFEAQGVNKIIALTHIGYDDNPLVDNDIELAKNVEGIDVIVGGHTHTQLDEPIIVDTNTVGVAKDATLIVQAYQYADYLGTLDVTFNEEGVVTEYAGELIKLADVVEDEEALKILAPFKEQVDKVATNEIGVTLKAELTNPRQSSESDTPGESVRANETILGNLITDGMRAKAQKFTDKKVVMALQNGGGIRAAIPAGNVTVGQVITVLPFGNTLALMDTTGAELQAAFEVSVQQLPKENGGFLHVSGARVTYDSSKPTGERVVSIELLNADGTYTAIEADKTYTVATNAFTAKGGDGFDMFAKAYAEGRVTDLGLSDWENFAEHLKGLKTIPTEIEGRIIDKVAK